MKIIGGKFRGRKLVGPKDDRIRPTTGRLRESIFSALEHRIGGFEGKRVADIFSGTGAFGFEALSRGAEKAVWVEKHPDGILLLEQNIELLGVTGKTEIIRADARNLPKTEAAFEVIFLDPPYGRGLAEPALISLEASGWLGKESWAVLEKEKRENFDLPQTMEIVKTITQGYRQVLFIRRK